MKRVLLAAIVLPCLCLALCFLFLWMFLNRGSEYLLHAAGYRQATVEASVLDTDGILLKNIDFGNGTKIASAKISVSLPDMLRRKENALRVVIGGGVVNADTPWGPLPLGGDGTLLPHGTGWRWNSDISGETKFARVAGHLTTDIEKDGTKKSHFELAEGRIATPGFEAKRLTGWVENDTSGTLTGQVTAGVVQGEGVDFQDVNATISNGQIMLTGADRTGKRMAVDLRPDGSVFCNGHPAAYEVKPEPAEIMKLAKACLQAP